MDSDGEGAGGSLSHACYSGGSVSIAASRGPYGAGTGRLVKRAKERRINSAELEHRGEGHAFE